MGEGTYDGIGGGSATDVNEEDGEELTTSTSVADDDVSTRPAYRRLNPSYTRAVLRDVTNDDSIRRASRRPPGATIPTGAPRIDACVVIGSCVSRFAFHGNRPCVELCRLYSLIHSCTFLLQQQVCFALLRMKCFNPDDDPCLSTRERHLFVPVSNRNPRGGPIHGARQDDGRYRVVERNRQTGDRNLRRRDCD